MHFKSLFKTPFTQSLLIRPESYHPVINSAANLLCNSSQISIVKCIFIFTPTPPLPSLHQRVPAWVAAFLCWFSVSFCLTQWSLAAVNAVLQTWLTSTWISEHRLLLGWSPWHHWDLGHVTRRSRIHNGQILPSPGFDPVGPIWKQIREHWVHIGRPRFPPTHSKRCLFCM